MCIRDRCTAIDEYIEKINTSIEFLQEKKRNGEHLDAEKEAYISSAIRLKVQKGMDKKPLKTRIEEIQKIINAKETLSVQVTKCVYPNVRINLNSFTTTTSAEYGKCNIVCGPNDIEFRSVSYTHLDVYKRQALRSQEYARYIQRLC